MKNIGALFFLLLIVCGCRDLQEKDITKNETTLISPPDNYKSGVAYQTFYWEKVDGAQKYRIQIASPNFDPGSMYLVLDSLTKSTSFSTTLEAKKYYQWRVAAVNSAYESVFSAPRNLYIDSSLIIAIQKVQLLQPSPSLSKSGVVRFNWKAVAQAIRYNLVVTLDNVTIYDTIINAPSVSSSFNLKSEGKYFWKVKAEDETGQSTAYSESNDAFSPIIDNTKPVITLNSDSTNAGTNSITLKWSSSDVNGILRDSVFVFQDALQQRIVKGFPVIGTNSQFILRDSSSITTPFWYRISTVDKALNSSSTILQKVRFIR